MLLFTKMKCFSKLDYFLILSMALLFGIATGSRYSSPYLYPNYKTFMGRMHVDGTAYKQVCATPGCNTAAQLIRDNIDESVNPCNNFYDFGCGGFVSKARLSPDRPLVGHLEDIQERIIQDLAKTFMEPSKPEEPRIFQLVKNYYKACMDLDAIEKVGIQPLLRIFDEIGGWPILKGPGWNETKFNWMEADSILRANGFPPTRIIKLYAFNDIHNTSKNLLHIEPADLDISPRILTRNLFDPVVQSYIDFMVKIAEAFGADKNLARSQLRDVLLFEREIHNAIMYGESVPGPELNTIIELETNLGNLPWKNYLNGLTKPISSLESHDKIIVLNSNYLKKMDTVLPGISNRILANYMIWNIIVESIPNLGMSIQRILNNYIRSKGHEIQVPDRSKQCVLFLTNENQGMTVGVSALYTRRYFSNETKIDIKDIVHSIGDEFKSFILQVSWLDDAAKIKAIRKSLYMKQIVGYPNELDDDILIDNYSKSLVIEPDNHFQNVLNVRRFHYDDSIDSLGEPADKRSWITFSDATKINAFYYSMANSFVLLAAILQYPIYDPRWPAYIKYGSVGFIIGHETMHAFDVGGVMHDETGSLREPRREHFSAAVEREYLSRVDCYVDQYSQYRDFSLNLTVNGMLTVNENLADNVGMKVALAAYKKWTREHPDEPMLPGLRYTPAQLFWMSTVNIMCSKQTDGVLMNMMLTDEHTPDKFRALGALSNMPEFAKDFNCSLGSEMNPPNKCNLL